MTLRNASTGAILSLRGAAVPRGRNLDAYLAHGWVQLSPQEVLSPARGEYAAAICR